MEIWQQMELIFRAHMTAGHHITKMLLNVVSKADFDKLAKFGKQDFMLPDQDANRITAFRIKEIAPETAPIPETQLGIPLEAL